MPEQIRESIRSARKAYHCGTCVSVISVGESHHVSTNVFDGRVYDWRTCAACSADGILAEVYDWAGMPDEGVDSDSAQEWAHEAQNAGPGHPEIVRMATAFLVRFGCGCERCEHRSKSGVES
jgi:hypothetical protein